MVGCILLLPFAFALASAQNADLKAVDLKGKVQLTRNRRSVNENLGRLGRDRARTRLLVAV